MTFEVCFYTIPPIIEINGMLNVIVKLAGFVFSDLIKFSQGEICLTVFVYFAPVTFRYWRFRSFCLLIGSSETCVVTPVTLGKLFTAFVSYTAMVALPPPLLGTN